MPPGISERQQCGSEVAAVGSVGGRRGHPPAAIVTGNGGEAQMPLQHAVLALLAVGPNHGYELKSAFEATVGPQWGGLNIGHVYQLLDRAERDGLVASHRQPQSVKPDRRVYSLTEAGEVELARWLDGPSERQGGFRDDFFLKLMAAARAPDPAVLAGVVARQRAHLLGELRSLASMRTGDVGPVVDLLLTAAELHVRADLDLLDEAEHTDLRSVRAIVRAGAAARGAHEAAAPPVTNPAAG
jgi:DNA-binding PadR family transcriptional regulator